MFQVTVEITVSDVTSVHPPKNSINVETVFVDVGEETYKLAHFQGDVIKVSQSITLEFA